MEAILDLVLALVVGLVQGLVAIVQLIFNALILVVEFLFVALTQGIETAQERKASRLAERRENVLTRRHDEPEQSRGDEQTIPKGTGKALAITGALLLVSIPAVWFGLKIRAERRERQRDQTQQQIEELADGFAEKCKQDNLGGDGRSLLKERDVWGQRLELFTDQFTLGTLIVVRSAGLDGERKTIDDQLAIQFVRKKLKDVAKDAAKKPVENLKQKARNLLNRFRNIDDDEEAEENNDE